MLAISTDFPGGNARILSIKDNTVYIDTDLRDTTVDWFYWSICVTGAAGETVTFDFEGKNRIGYYGPAVSYDLKHWSWLEKDSSESRFTYTFRENENKVYFAHNMVYSAEMFLEFAHKNSIEVKELCTSRKGRAVPCVSFGEGERSIVFTARHHACESTGSYVLEGILEELHRKPLEGVRVFCVPFVDFDGVVDGDQGKSRAPYDHNRDYERNSAPLYPSVREIRRYVDNHNIVFGFDFHSPWHRGTENDFVYIVERSVEKQRKMDIFGQMFKENVTESALKYRTESNYAPNGPWSATDVPTFAKYVLDKPENEFAFTLETCYFGRQDNVFTQDKARELGRCFARTIRQYLKL